MLPVPDQEPYTPDNPKVLPDYGIVLKPSPSAGKRLVLEGIAAMAGITAIVWLYTSIRGRVFDFGDIFSYGFAAIVLVFWYYNSSLVRMDQHGFAAGRWPFWMRLNWKDVAGYAIQETHGRSPLGEPGPIYRLSFYGWNTAELGSAVFSLGSVAERQEALNYVKLVLGEPMAPTLTQGKILPQVFEVETDHTRNWPESTLVIEHPDRNTKKWWGLAIVAALINTAVQTVIRGPFELDRFLIQLHVQFALFFAISWFFIYRPRIQLDPRGITLGRGRNPKHIPWRVIRKYQIIAPQLLNLEHNPTAFKYIAFYNAQGNELGRIQEIVGTKEQREAMLLYIHQVLGEPSPK